MNKSSTKKGPRGGISPIWKWDDAVETVLQQPCSVGAKENSPGSGPDVAELKKISSDPKTGTVEVGKLQTEGAKEKEESLTNYCVHPIKKFVYVDRFGKEDKKKEKIACQIQIGDGKPQNFEVLTQDIKRLVVIIGDKFSGALLNPNIPHAAKLVENQFRNETKRIPVARIFVDFGWQLIDGKRIYGHDNITFSSDTAFETGMGLPFYKSITSQQISQVFFDARNIYGQAGPMSVMLAFSMTGVLYRVFKEAGHAPHFLLFLYGKTGSMKTTIAKILFMQLTDEQYRDTPRRVDSDTVTSFERGIILSGRDTVTLIDDFAPAKTPKQKA